MLLVVLMTGAMSLTGRYDILLHPALVADAN